MPAAPCLIVADIGGTNSRLACASGTEVDRATVRRYRNEEFARFEDVLAQYVQDQDVTDCATLCVAVAGPVRDGEGALTNRDWRFTRESLAPVCGAATVVILNDLQAQGHGLGFLPSSSLTHISGPVADGASDAAKLVIGIGTGFNVAPVYNAQARRLVPPAEAGHSTMPVRDADDLALFQTLSHSGMTSVEEVLSGRGFEGIYTFLARDSDAPTRAAHDILPAAAQGAPIARATVDTFCRLLGQVAGDLSLIHLPFGGVYLVGGMAQAVTPHLNDGAFETGFRDKGRFSDFMTDFPVYVVQDDYAALMGCAACASDG